MENRAQENHARSNLDNFYKNRAAENSMYVSETYMNSSAIAGHKLCVEVQSQYENARVKSNIRTNLYSNVAVESVHHYDEPSITMTTPETREARAVQSRSANDSDIRTQNPPTLHPRMRIHRRPITRHYARLRHSVIERLSKTSNTKIALVTLISCLVGAGVAAGIICTLYFTNNISIIRQNDKDESSSGCPPCADLCNDKRFQVATPENIEYFTILCKGKTFVEAKEYCSKLKMKLYDPESNNKKARFILNCLEQGSKCISPDVKYWTSYEPRTEKRESCNRTLYEPQGGPNKHKLAGNCNDKHFLICVKDY